MKKLLIAALATAGLAWTAYALLQPATGVNPEAAKQSAEETLKLAQQVMPKGVPVPDMPTLNRTELEGGLIVEDMKIGDGYEVSAGGAVVAHYHGTVRESGKVFQSSFETGEPIGFSLNRVIQGWSKGLPGMKVGGVRKLTIPTAMAYAARPPSPDIPPNADLVFIVQLMDAMQVVDVKEGEGEAAEFQCVPVTAHVIKDKDGKEVERVEASKPYVWLPGEYSPISYGVSGMKVGGTRKIIVPAELNEVVPGAPASRPMGQRVEMEITIVALRNIPKGGR
jgi:FKBP-type peptidyl-prolyl cis-trans isomerase